ncbi:MULTISPECIES: DUF3769 domain-containing protein [unclassified Coleofasciculus]|uniref:DUF3769 domain-containing protein n=1 Tax=unclassified Coleofasciculus TaxID=2692782 RepID=UPI00188296A6|nr:MULTISPECIES: DUF3769 domain-containing protein [unclassified Coleofasciculus]MBE9127616.1 DUF3769 domain-containing protein [Coleofasciculus sp. LEGE 07081]MBE9149663.1 DUF3769 domain-containing protein [Coleofasciculus sp. LEGE 07092]
MPQPVQPPETPAIIQSVTLEDGANQNPSSEVIVVSPKTQTQPTGLIATPSPPETLPPESSSLMAPRSAALLGPPICVSHSQPKIPVATPVLPVAQVNVEGANLPNPSPETEVDAPSTETVVENDNIDREIPSTSKNPQLTFGVVREVSVKTDLHPARQDATPASPSPHLPLTNPPISSANPTQTKNSSPSIPNLASNTTPVTLDLSNVERLVTQERSGEVREFEFTVPAPETQSTPEEEVPNEEVTPTSPSPGTPESETTEPANPAGISGVIELTADRQEYDQERQVITAEGNVELLFRGALLNADRVQVNLPNRILVAEGNVALTRGDQVLRGERFEYYFVQDSGVVLNANGELYVPTAGRDLTILPSPTDPNAPEEQRPISDRITTNQPLQGITNPGFYSFFLGGSFALDNQNVPASGGVINRFRYEADRIDFEGSETVATNVRLTNDPFSPPELELRADTARFRRISPLVDEIVATRPRLVFDQGLSVPTFRNRVVIDRRPRSPGLVNFGFDDDDRGGLFAERTFEVVNTPAVRFRLTPQYFIQKAILGDDNPNTPGMDEGGILDPSSFGLKAQLDAVLTPRTTLVGSAVFTSFDPDEIEDELRASVRLRQVIGTGLPHNLNLEYSYRDRLFNGSLGFQTVQSSLGAVITSPVIPLGNTGINLTYQGGVQNINSETDRQDLLPPPPRDNNRINLTRYQASANLSRGFLLWQGEALPPTLTEGLRYTPRPVVPYLSLNGVVTGVGSFYSSGDTQGSLSATVGLSGQVGHFSRPYLDYTGFNISYTQVALGDLSPFLFDRVADNQVLSLGITQQIYGPFRLGFQTSYNIDTGEQISTDFFLEYSRRTYNILLRYNPVQELGSISLRINDFNWAGNPGLFDGSEIRPVVQGVTR